MLRHSALETLYKVGKYSTHEKNSLTFKEIKNLKITQIACWPEKLKELRNKRMKKEILNLGPDAKSQFSIKYKNGKPAGLHSVVLSVQHQEGNTPEKIKEEILPIIEEIKPNTNTRKYNKI